MTALAAPLTTNPVGATNSDVTFTDPTTGQNYLLVIKGDMLAHSVNIVDVATGFTVAVMTRQWLNKTQLITGRQTYVVTIAPGMDMLIVAAVVIAMDERRNDGGA